MVSDIDFQSLLKMKRQLAEFRYGKKTFCQNSDKFLTALLKMRFCLCIYFSFARKNIISSLYKIDTLNFTMYIITIYN